MLQELFGTWTGILSLLVLGFILLMATYFYRMATQKMRDPNEQG